MPILNDENTQTFTGTTFGFSGHRVDTLGATEYTLVAIAADCSGSVQPFADEISSAIESIAESCRRSPRADNLMLRLVTFNSRLDEVHGFRPLTECPPDAYQGVVKPYGMTALYDAAVSVVESVMAYGRQLHNGDFDANGIVFVLTDGLDNGSTLTPRSVSEALRAAVTSEALESMVSILVGVNVQGHDDQALRDLATKAGFTQYVGLADANPSSLARLAQFVSQSISAQSAALGTGGASKALTF